MTLFGRIVKNIHPEQYKRTAMFLSKHNIDTLNNIKHNINQSLKQVKKREIMRTEYRNLGEELQEGTYFDAKIVNQIKDKYVKTVVFDYQGEINIKLLFHFLSNSSKHNLELYKNIMLSWLLLLKTYETPECVKTVEVHVYLTQFKKMLEYKGSGNDDIVPLGSYNVNTGFTSRCSDYMKGKGMILLYRQEDFLKVFFHETMHLFNMEFHDTGKHTAKQIIKIASDINIFESYCETWARIINIIYYSIYNPKKDIQTLMIVESLYSFKQAIKVLDYYNLSIEDIHNNTEKVGKLFVESSNVYSYYIVTAMFLTHPENYLTFCKTFNLNLLKFNEKHLTEYVHLLKSILESRNLITIKDVLFSENEWNNDEDGASLKMTYYDIVI